MIYSDPVHSTALRCTHSTVPCIIPCYSTHLPHGGTNQSPDGFQAAKSLTVLWTYAAASAPGSDQFGIPGPLAECTTYMLNIGGDNRNTGLSHDVQLPIQFQYSY